MRSSPQNKSFIFLSLLCYNHKLSIAHHNVKGKRENNHSSQKLTVRRIVVAKGMVFVLWLVRSLVKHKNSRRKGEMAQCLVDYCKHMIGINSVNGCLVRNECMVRLQVKL